MQKCASYNPESHAHGLSGEVERLKDQAELTWDAERRRLQALEIINGQHVLELGCGPGAWTRLLAEWLPRSAIVGLDYDESMLAYAQSARLLGKSDHVFARVRGGDRPGTRVV